MIGSLHGKLAAKQAPQILVECNGVGYEVETPMSTFLELPAVGETVFVHTHLLVRDDAHILFGFASPEERSLFRMLLKISGVGAKMGLAILSTMSVADFQRCVEYEDAATLVKIPGVGKKTAERLIIHGESEERSRGRADRVGLQGRRSESPYQSSRCGGEVGRRHYSPCASPGGRLNR
jgi:Holliday junction DNA helicase RuvA